MRLSDHASQSPMSFSFPFWYPLFDKYALTSIHLPLPSEFVSFLLADGVYLGEGSRALPRRGEAEFSSDEEQEEADDSRSQHSGSSSASNSTEEDRDFLHQFPDLRTQIQQAIEQLGGRVVPKLNWSCPTDATWINPGGSLACDNADQVVLMLKSSDRITHDLELLASLGATSTSDSQPPTASTAQAAGNGTTSAAVPAGASVASGSSEATEGAATSGMQAGSSAQTTPPSPSTSPPSTRTPASHPVLVLRKWYDLRPEREWRRFVRGRDLVGVCQRDVTQHFPQLTRAADAEGSHSSHGSMMVVGSNGVIRQRQLDSASSAGQHGFDPARDEPGREALQAAQLLENFFESRIRGRFPLIDFTFDAYVATNNTVKLIDLNPVGGTTSPLLFTWEELGLGHAAGIPPAAAAEEAQQMQEDQGEQQQVQEGAGSAAGTDSRVVEEDRLIQQAGGSSEQPRDGGGEGDASEYDSEEESVSDEEDDDIRSRVLVRIVPSAGIVQPGQRAVCGMPIDMLQLKESVEGLVRLMAQQGVQDT